MLKDSVLATSCSSVKAYSILYSIWSNRNDILEYFQPLLDLLYALGYQDLIAYRAMFR